MKKVTSILFLSLALCGAANCTPEANAQELNTVDQKAVRNNKAKIIKISLAIGVPVATVAAAVALVYFTKNAETNNFSNKAWTKSAGYLTSAKDSLTSGKDKVWGNMQAHPYIWSASATGVVLAGLTVADLLRNESLIKRVAKAIDQKVRGKDKVAIAA